MDNRKDLLKIGVLGMGNAGGNVAAIAMEEGFDSVAVNAATNDLDRLPDDITKFPIGDGNGTGKDREAAKQFLRDHSGILKDKKFSQFLMDNDAIFVVSSTGGGFGSGASILMCDMIQDILPEKCIVPVGIFPFHGEGYTAQNHSVEWLKELTEGNRYGYMYYDNNRLDKMIPEIACGNINNEIVTALKIFRGDFIMDDSTGGIDQRDMMTLLSVPKRIVAYYMSVEDADIEENSLVKTIIEKIHAESSNAPLVDDKQIMASAFIYRLHSQFYKYVSSIKEDMQEVLGNHLNDYSNFHNLRDEDDVEDGLAIILSGLSDSTQRIDKMINQRDKMANNILNRKGSSSKLDRAEIGNSKLRLGAKSFSAGMQAKSPTNNQKTATVQLPQTNVAKLAKPFVAGSSDDNVKVTNKPINS